MSTVGQVVDGPKEAIRKHLNQKHKHSTTITYIEMQNITNYVTKHSTIVMILYKFILKALIQPYHTKITFI